jgi:ABC-type Fe3+-siderophore transport system permease subunit
MPWVKRILRAALVGALLGFAVVLLLRLESAATAGQGHWGLGAGAVALLVVALAVRHRLTGRRRGGK